MAEEQPQNKPQETPAAPAGQPSQPAKAVRKFDKKKLKKIAIIAVGVVALVWVASLVFLPNAGFRLKCSLALGYTERSESGWGANYACLSPFMPTTDGGKACYGSGGECQGACVGSFTDMVSLPPPPGSLAAQLGLPGSAPGGTCTGLKAIFQEYGSNK